MDRLMYYNSEKDRLEKKINLLKAEKEYKISCIKAIFKKLNCFKKFEFYELGGSNQMNALIAEIEEKYNNKINKAEKEYSEISDKINKFNSKLGLLTAQKRVGQRINEINKTRAVSVKLF